MLEEAAFLPLMERGQTLQQPDRPRVTLRDLCFLGVCLTTGAEPRAMATR
jgi:hypothetical protein